MEKRVCRCRLSTGARPQAEVTVFAWLSTLKGDLRGRAALNEVIARMASCFALMPASRAVLCSVGAGGGPA